MSLNEETGTVMMQRITDSLAILTPRLEILELVDGNPYVSSTTDLLPLSMTSTASMGLFVSEGTSEIHRYDQGL